MKNNFLYKLESDSNLLSIFNYKGTSAWVSVKNYINFKLLGNVRLESFNKKDIFTFNGITIILYSIKHYFIALFNRKEKNLFLGATTGLFTYKNQIKDSYFPEYDFSPKNCIYMLNNGNLSSFMKYKKYFLEHHIVIENYLIAPLKKVIGSIISLFVDKNIFSDFVIKVEELSSNNFTEKEIQKNYCNFIAGYTLYRLLFKMLKIKQAYIVSAYTKSDIVAALQSLDIKVIEIQHGIIGKKHTGYNYQVSNIDLPTPDIVNVYNQFWKDDLLNGNYFTDKQINIVGKLKYNLASSKSLENNAYIVFTGQAVFSDKLFLFMVDANDFLVENNIILYYLPHPKETKKEIDFFKKKVKASNNIIVYDGNETTEQLIKHSIAHISIYSACHFDAIHFLNITYILDIFEDNYMNDYIKWFPEKFIKIQRLVELNDKIHKNYLENK